MLCPLDGRTSLGSVDVDLRPVELEREEFALGVCALERPVEVEVGIRVACMVLRPVGPEEGSDKRVRSGVERTEQEGQGEEGRASLAERG